MYYHQKYIGERLTLNLLEADERFNVVVKASGEWVNGSGERSPRPRASLKPGKMGDQLYVIRPSPWYVPKECARETWADFDTLGSVQPSTWEGVAHTLHEAFGREAGASQANVVEEDDG